MISRLNIRRIEEEKEENLSPHAAKSSLSRGRLKYEEPCPIRTAFQRDRDRIIHSNAFRRLKHKTQVFITPLGDHYVTRLTHTLEVSQIARTISRALNLNEDLAEAISLGHDLGHTPFGHIGEEVLNKLYPQGFQHNVQSLRIVDVLEKNGRGLNLTWEVRDGILYHSKIREDIRGDDLELVSTLEGQIVKIADAIAYINHDIGDAIRASIISEADLPISAVKVLGFTHSQRINTMICDIIRFSHIVRDGSTTERPAIGMSSEILESSNKLRDFLFERVYNTRSVLNKADKAKEVIYLLYNYFNEHEDKLPPDYQYHSEDLAQRVVDYIAGMTDHYALRMTEELYLTSKERIKLHQSKTEATKHSVQPTLPYFA